MGWSGAVIYHSFAPTLKHSANGLHRTCILYIRYIVKNIDDGFIIIIESRESTQGYARYVFPHSLSARYITPIADLLSERIIFFAMYCLIMCGVYVVCGFVCMLVRIRSERSEARPTVIIDSCNTKLLFAIAVVDSLECCVGECLRERANIHLT